MTEFHIRQLEADQAKAAKRSETLNELREWLDGKQREALQEDPYGRFVIRIPVELLANLTPAEREELEAFERGAFDRHRPLAQARDEQRRAFVAAGGTAEAFDANWETYGRDAHAAQLASANIERTHHDDVF